MRVKPMIRARCGAAIAVVGGRIYVIGGSRLQREDYDCTEVYDPKTGHWTALGPMLDKRTRHRAAVVDGNIYVLGGTHWVGNSNVTLFSAEVLNPEQGHWVQVATLPQIPPDSWSRSSTHARHREAALYHPLPVSLSRKSLAL